MRLIQIVLTVFFVMGFISACSVQQVKDELNHGEISSFISKAEQGDADAQYNLAYMYDTGDGVPQDHKKAVYWCTKAAEQGHTDAQYNLAYMYEYGEGVHQDYKEAIYWYTKAAEQGHPIAQFILGGICGQAYEEALDEKEQRNKKGNDDGDD